MSDDLETAIEEATEAVHEIGDDVERFTQAQSAEFYEAVAADASAMARMIRSEVQR